jgi:hypothetical protein
VRIVIEFIDLMYWEENVNSASYLLRVHVLGNVLSENTGDRSLAMEQGKEILRAYQK